MNQFAAILLFCLVSCGRDSVENLNISFDSPKKVTITGYDRDIMEPFLSRDGKFLFFNNVNDPDTNTNIYYAERINDTTFNYRGEVNGVNSGALDAVASMDNDNNFYFVTTRSYIQNLSTIYRGLFVNGTITNVDVVTGVSRSQPGIVNFDVEVSADGNSLYFPDGQFSGSGQFQSADLVYAIKSGTVFQRANNSDQILRNVNTNQLEYAACISKNELTLYFTRVPQITSTAVPRIYYATRKSKDEPFSSPQEIIEFDGFVEAASLSADETIVYFHKRENNRFVLYSAKKK